MKREKRRLGHGGMAWAAWLGAAAAAPGCLAGDGYEDDALFRTSEGTSSGSGSGGSTGSTSGETCGEGHDVHYELIRGTGVSSSCARARADASRRLTERTQRFVEACEELGGSASADGPPTHNPDGAACHETMGRQWKEKSQMMKCCFPEGTFDDIWEEDDHFDPDLNLACPAGTTADGDVRAIYGDGASGVPGDLETGTCAEADAQALEEFLADLQAAKDACDGTFAWEYDDIPMCMWDGQWLTFIWAHGVCCAAEDEDDDDDEGEGTGGGTTGSSG